MVRRFLALLLGVLVVAGCAELPVEPEPLVGSARDAAILTGVIASVAELAPEPAVAPIVYVVGVQGTLEIEVQATVAANLMDMCDLRFADDPAEAFEEVDGEWRLRAGAVLLVIGSVPSEEQQVEVAVIRQTAAGFSEDLIVTVTLRDLDWTVTEVSVSPVSG
jgi:hypothetical protein